MMGTRSNREESIDVAIEFAPGVSGCGAIGCRESAGVFRVTIEGVGERVVCGEHLEKLVRRELQGGGVADV